MNDPRRNEVKTLFAAALELPRGDRGALLARESAGRPELYAEVQSLLEAHDRPGEFLDTITHEYRSRALAASSGARSRIGERIGAYRIVGLLGTGGMGDVFQAVRDDDQYHAEVAIKLMRADMRSTFTEQRFRTERQILAQLDHRNIARLLDGGTTSGGMPYVVMELVAGEPIDQYCQARSSSVRDRVQLFLQVCAAVSYAHQHLVVHRDLKPSNILVTRDGSVKLLDFGIAKLLEANADTVPAPAGETATTLRAMTLDYASPEQVGGGAVTTVSDVYSLGVVLYRLLTGKSPYSARGSEAQRVAEIVGDTPPTRPSALERNLDQDLDNILLMALRKEPQRRYGSVEQFASDLRSYLAGMPVIARGNSFGYRAGKFIRRRKVEIAAGVVVAGAVLAALAVSLRETRIAEHEREVAQQHFDSVRKLANTMLFKVHDEMAHDAGSIRSREMLVKTSLEYLDALYKQGGTDRQLQEELAEAYIKVALIQGSDTEANRGDYSNALESYSRAISMLTPLVADTPASPQAGQSLARAYVEQASLLMVSRGPKHARESADLGVALTEKFAPSIADEAERMTRLRTAYAVQARILGFMGLARAALDSLDKLIAICEGYLRAHPQDERGLLALSLAYSNAAIIDDPRLGASATYERARTLLKKSNSAAEKLVALKPADLEYRLRLSSAQFNLGNLSYMRGQYAEALERYEEALPPALEYAQDADDTRAQYSLGLHETRIALALVNLRRIEEAQPLLLSSERKLAAVFKRDGSLRTEFAVGLNAMARGKLLERRAVNSAQNLAALSELWRQAQASLELGLASMRHVSANAALPAVDRALVREGEEALQRVSAALAKSSRGSSS